MKKSLTYATIAVLVGVTLMFMPFSLFQAESKNRAEVYTEQRSPEQLINTLHVSSVDSERLAGITPHYPLDIVSVGLMLTFSLIPALIISSQLRKK